MTLPNFIYLGPPKSASTWLFAVLRSHPNVFIPPAKDIYFFDRHYDRGLDWYARHFSAAKPYHTAIGEISHDYLYSQSAAERIAHDIPGVKLITVLRNPYERSLSHYKFVLRNGVTYSGFEEALTRRDSIVDLSLYAEHLSTYLKIFDRKQIYIGLFDDITRQPKEFIRGLLQFLEQDHSEEVLDSLPIYQRYNVASAPRSIVAARVIRSVTNKARALGLSNLIGHIKHSPVTRMFYKNTKSLSVKISQNEFDRMKSRFLPDMDALEQMTDIDLREWRNTSLKDLER